MIDLNTYLHQERMLTDETIDKFGLRISGNQIIIPVEACERVYVPGGDPKIRWSDSCDSPLPPFPSWEVLRRANLIAEGEFDAMLASQQLGIEVASGTAGSGTWIGDWSDSLTGRSVTLLYDNDDPGLKGSRHAAESLVKSGCQVRIARWPDDKPKGWDITDHFRAMGSVEELWEIINAAEEFVSPGLALPASEFISLVLPPHGMLVDRIWPEQAIGFVAGPAKSFKSFLVLDFAFAVATGKTFLNKFTAPQARRVLLIQGESSMPAFQHRVKMATARFGDTPKLYIITNRRVSLEKTDAIETLRDEIARIRPSLVVLDPLSSFMQGDENSAQAINAILDTLRGIRDDYRTAFVVVHHSRKPGQQKNERAGLKMRGSSALYAGSEALISMERVSDEALRSKIMFEQKDGDSPEPCEVYFEPSTQAINILTNKEAAIAAMANYLAQNGPMKSKAEKLRVAELEKPLVWQQKELTVDDIPF